DVRSRLERGDRGDVGLRSAVLQILSEKRTEDFLAEVKGGVAAELYGAERTAVADHLTMMPWADYQQDLGVCRVLRFDGLVHREGAVNVFLVPQAVNEHHRRFQRLGGQQLVDGLVAPESVVGGMLDELVPKAQLIEAAAATQLTGRNRLHPHVV